MPVVVKRVCVYLCLWECVGSIAAAKTPEESVRVFVCVRERLESVCEKEYKLKLLATVAKQTKK